MAATRRLKLFWGGGAIGFVLIASLGCSGQRGADAGRGDAGKIGGRGGTGRNVLWRRMKMIVAGLLSFYVDGIVGGGV